MKWGQNQIAILAASLIFSSCYIQPSALVALNQTNQTPCECVVKASGKVEPK